MKEINVRRSGRARKAATYTGMVSTAENVSMKDIPLNDYVSHTSKATYKFSMPVLLKEKKSREKTGYDIQILEQTLIDDEVFYLHSIHSHALNNILKTKLSIIASR